MTKLKTDAVDALPETGSQKPKAPGKASAAKQKPDVTSKKVGAAAKPAPAKKAAKPAKEAKTSKKTAQTTEASVPRTESKGSKILELIGRTNGATLAEIMNATDWQAHSVRGFLSIASKKRGIKIESTKNDDGVRNYTVKN